MDTENKVADFTGFLEDFKDKSTGYTIIDSFIEKSLEDTETLAENLDTGNFTSLHRIAHTLKGGAMNIGAPAMMEKSLALEKRIKDRNYYESGIDAEEKKVIAGQISELKKSIVRLKDFFSGMDKG